MVTWMANRFSYHIHGATDDFGFHAVKNRVHVHDLHATMLHLPRFDHESTNPAKDTVVSGKAFISRASTVTNGRFRSLDSATNSQSYAVQRDVAARSRTCVGLTRYSLPPISVSPACTSWMAWSRGISFCRSLSLAAVRARDEQVGDHICVHDDHGRPASLA